MDSKKIIIFSLLLLVFALPSVFAADALMQWVNAPTDNGLTIQEGDNAPFFYNANVYGGGFYTIKLYDATTGNLVSTIQEKYGMTKGEKGFLNVTYANYKPYGNFKLVLFASDPSSDEKFTLGLTVICTDANKNGICDDDEHNALPVAIFTANPESGYAPLTVFFNASESYDPDGMLIMYSWDLNDNPIHFAQGETAKYTFTQPGTYKVTLFVVDDDEGVSNVSKYITVLEKQNHAPVASFSFSPLTPYVNDTITFDASSSYDVDNDSLTYAWTFGDGTNANGKIVTHAYTHERSYGVTLTVTDTHGATANATKTVFISVKPNHPPVLNPIGAKTIYEGEPITFIVNATDVDHDTLTYSATNLPVGSSFSGQRFSWTPSFNQSGVYTVTFSVSDGKATDVENVPITVLNVNRRPTADFSINPNPALVGQQVILDASASSDPDGDSLTYSWNLGDSSGLEGEGKILHYAYEEQGTFTITLTVSDGALQSTTQKTIVVENKIIIDGISCIPEIIAGDVQSCGVKVRSVSGLLGNADVDVYYLDGTYFGSCTTDKDGDCRAQAVVSDIGNYTVYAKATKPGYINDTDTYPRTSFIAYKERYDIDALKVYNDSAFMHEDYDFFRGENLYVKFRVKELHTNAFVTDDIVAKALLVSQGYATAELTKIGMDNEYFLFQLTPIPLKHDFIGSSQIFTFAFNYSDGSGGQKEVGVMIRNNPPKIQPVIPDAELVVGDMLHYDLSLHEFDLEDSEENLSWRYTKSGSSVSTSIEGKTLHMHAVAPGITTITVILTDWDGDTAQQTFTVTVVAQPENNTAPVVTIIEPLNGAEFVQGTVIHFSGTALDKEDGALTPTWSSSKDGNLGNGNEIDHVLSLGTHTITLSAIDSEGIESSDTITITVVAQPENNTAPVVTILQPANGADFEEGTIIHFIGTATDKEDGTLIPTWSSSKDGILGDGNTIQAVLSVGTHVITLTAKDGEGLEGSDSITITIKKKETPHGNLTAEIGGPYHAYPNTIITLDASKSTGDIQYYIFDFGDGTSVTQTTPFAPHIYDGKKNTYTVTLTVVGFHNETAQDTTSVFMKSQGTTAVPVDEHIGNELYVSPVKVYGLRSLEDYKVKVNEDLVVSLGIENHGDDLQGVTATVTIPELGIRQSTDNFRLNTGAKVSKSIVIPMDYALPGEYYLRLVVGNGRTERVLYRYVIVE